MYDSLLALTIQDLKPIQYNKSDTKTPVPVLLDAFPTTAYISYMQIFLLLTTALLLYCKEVFVSNNSSQPSIPSSIQPYPDRANDPPKKSFTHKFLPFPKETHITIKLRRIHQNQQIRGPQQKKVPFCCTTIMYD